MIFVRLGKHDQEAVAARDNERVLDEIKHNPLFETNAFTQPQEEPILNSIHYIT